jgi:hypothetical protein
MIRETPFILGRPTVQNLYMFLSGFAFARKECQEDDYGVLSKFGTFVHRRFQVTASQSWANIIAFYSVSETEEMKLFWKLWDEFCSKEGRSNARKDSTPVHARTNRNPGDDAIV